MVNPLYDHVRGRQAVTRISKQARRSIAAGAFAVAAIAAPFAASALSAAPAQDLAGPACLAWFGNKEDGNCLSYANGNGINVGTPEVAFGENGLGISTGPLLPGRTISQGVN
jgi:hypothetical protein